MKRLIILGLVSCVTIFTVYAGSSSVDLGGDNTVYDSSEGAFEHPLPLLNADELERFEQGDDLFATEFTPQTGLGPIFNATSCEGCHAADGRGRPPSFTGETSTGLLIRLALDRPSRDGSIEPDPVYGGQFQDVGTGRTRQEGTLSITYRELHGTYADGTAYTLYAPNYQLADLQYGRLRPEITFSPRLAGQMIGLGLLEAVPETDLLTLTDPDDRNGDGISGRANYVWDTTENRYAIGRFGWKANQPSLLQQTAAAFNGDIGITSSFADQQPCTDRERQCDDALRNPPRNDPQRNAPPPPQNPLSLGALLPPPRNESAQHKPADTLASPTFEISDDTVQTVAFYSGSLAVPAQRNADDPQVMRGQAIFAQAACTSCHVSELHTGSQPTVAALSNQTIHPYTDLLLHDMGAGLADGQVNYRASGSEWRTAPLWGIGLLETVNGYAYYLHDGRARTLEEAILWHGGEASASQQAFVNLSAADRDALIAFLKSL